MDHTETGKNTETANSIIQHWTIEPQQPHSHVDTNKRLIPIENDKFILF
jgi:hypothetical protein